MREQNGVLTAYVQDAWVRGKSWQSIRTIIYWVCTFLIAFEMTAGALWGLLGIEYVRSVFAHLGYPMYLGTILGLWKLPFALVLFLPGLLRLKEWAYAGAVFNYTGAAASHFFAAQAGGSSVVWSNFLGPGVGGPAVFAVITLASWALRPPERRLPASPPSPSDGGMMQWMVPTLIVIAMFLLSWALLPQGAAPGS